MENFGEDTKRYIDYKHWIENVRLYKDLIFKSNNQVEWLFDEFTIKIELVDN